MVLIKNNDIKLSLLVQQNDLSNDIVIKPNRHYEEHSDEVIYDRVVSGSAQDVQFSTNSILVAKNNNQVPQTAEGIIKKFILDAKIEKLALEYLGKEEESNASDVKKKPLKYACKAMGALLWERKEYPGEIKKSILEIFNSNFDIKQKKLALQVLVKLHDAQFGKNKYGGPTQVKLVVDVFDEILKTKDNELFLIAFDRLRFVKKGKLADRAIPKYLSSCKKRLSALKSDETKVLLSSLHSLIKSKKWGDKYKHKIVGVLGKQIEIKKNEKAVKSYFASNVDGLDAMEDRERYFVLHAIDKMFMNDYNFKINKKNAVDFILEDVLMKNEELCKKTSAKLFVESLLDDENKGFETTKVVANKLGDLYSESKVNPVKVNGGKNGNIVLRNMALEALIVESFEDIVDDEDQKMKVIASLNAVNTIGNDSLRKSYFERATKIFLEGKFDLEKHEKEYYGFLKIYAKKHSKEMLDVIPDLAGKWADLASKPYNSEKIAFKMLMTIASVKKKVSKVDSSSPSAIAKVNRSKWFSQIVREEIRKSIGNNMKLIEHLVIKFIDDKGINKNHKKIIKYYLTKGTFEQKTEIIKAFHWDVGLYYKTFDDKYDSTIDKVCTQNVGLKFCKQYNEKWMAEKANAPEFDVALLGFSTIGMYGVAGPEFSDLDINYMGSFDWTYPSTGNLLYSGLEWELGNKSYEVGFKPIGIRDELASFLLLKAGFGLGYRRNENIKDPSSETPVNIELSEDESYIIAKPTSNPLVMDAFQLSGEVTVGFYIPKAEDTWGKGNEFKVRADFSLVFGMMAGTVKNQSCKYALDCSTNELNIYDKGDKNYSLDLAKDNMSSSCKKPTGFVNLFGGFMTRLVFEFK